MDQSVKIAVASSVLLGGILLALLFRRESPGAGAPAPAAGDRLVLRKHPPPSGGPLLSKEADGRMKSSVSAFPGLRKTPSEPRPTILKPMDPNRPPPALPRDYPARLPPKTSRWGASIQMDLPRAPKPEAPVQTHKIVDGDSLSSLAARYLGAADRHLEIYAANRHLLPSPQLLPIGVELTIPPCRSPTQPATNTPRGSRLVPIPRADGRH